MDFSMSYEARLADYQDGSDAKGIVRLMREYARIEECDREELERLPEILLGLDQGFTVLAFHERSSNVPIGLINCFFGFSTFELRPVVNVHDVIVTESHRGQGVARGMLECVESKSRSLNACRITLEVLADNPSAMRAYQKYGFGHDPSHKGVDTYFLRMPLSE